MEIDSNESSVPESVMDSVNSTLTDLQQLRSDFLQFLSLNDPDVLAQMQPLQRAQTLLVLAKTATTLLALRLRCTGVYPNDHPVKSELERIELYESKLEKLMDLSKEPLRPSTRLNYQAATRFIEHSLPDLTPDQRQGMREISKGKEPKKNYYSESGSAARKRKYPSSGISSVQTVAKEFLEKAARELLGNNEGGFKGPLVEISDDD